MKLYKYKFIFIHIPKSGGNSLHQLMKHINDHKLITFINQFTNKEDIDIKCEITKKSIKHVNILYYRNMYGNQINNYFKFTIVRNPYDRALSYYFYFYNTSKIFDKEKFIKLINNKEDTSLDPAHLFIDESFHIVYFEDLVQNLKNLNYFNDVIDINYDKFPKLNISYNSEINYENVLDEECKNIVYNKYKKDFELFNYKK
jgi:hypothetical protein